MNSLKKWLAFLPIAGLVIFTSIVLIRLQMASMTVQRDLDALTFATPLEIGATTTLEILPLYDGAASQPDLQRGLGVSYLIKTDSATILFDVGNNPEETSPSPLEQNMTKLGLSADQVDIFVFSHSHFDHRGGKYWESQGTFSIGGNSQIPLGDRPIYVPEAMTYPGSRPTIADSPLRIAEGVASTGSIPFVYPFPAWMAIPKGVEEALAINVKDVGIVLITGCGHMGLDSLITHAQSVFKAPVVGLIGGLHEGNSDVQQLQPEIQLLQKIHPRVVAISPHDSFAAALSAFEQAFPNAYQPLLVGRSIVIP